MKKFKYFGIGIIVVVIALNVGFSKMGKASLISSLSNLTSCNVAEAEPCNGYKYYFKCYYSTTLYCECSLDACGQWSICPGRGN